VKIRPHYIFLFLLLAFSASAQDFPSPKGYVNDFAGVVDAESARRIEVLARELQQKTGVQIALVTVKDLNGGNIDDFAVRLFEAWGIGQKGKDNGLLLVNATEDRRIRFEVGYGLEGILPDGRVGQILDAYVIPRLLENQYGPAYLAGLTAAAQFIARDAGVTLEGVSDPEPARRGQPQPPAGISAGFIIFLLILFLLFGRRGGCLWALPWIMMSGGGRRGGST